MKKVRIRFSSGFEVYFLNEEVQDSRPMEADIKLNMLNQFVTGKPKQAVEHYLLIGTEDAYQKAKSILQERCGNCIVVWHLLASWRNGLR